MGPFMWRRISLSGTAEAAPGMQVLVKWGRVEKTCLFFPRKSARGLEPTLA